MEHLYDVCSDYSLCNKVSKKSLDESKSSKYKWIKDTFNGLPILKGIHKKYEELHYIKCDSDINKLVYF